MAAAASATVFRSPRCTCHSPLSFARGIKKGDGGPSPSLQMGRRLDRRPMSSAALFCRALRRIHGRDDGHESTALIAGLERDLAVAEREQGMVLAHAHA